MPSTFSHGYALLIGVGECAYASLSLPVTVKDMQALRSVLIDPALCGYPDDEAHIRLLHDADATRGAILDSLSWLAKQTEADEEATAIVFYSGHGWLDKKTGGYYLIAHDLNYSNVTSSALSSEDFTKALRSIKARRLLVFMDCCHAAGMATAKDLPAPKLPPDYTQEAIPKGLVAELKQGEGRAVFSSSTSAQQSLIRPDKKLSIFTYHLIDALRGAGNRPGDTVVCISNLMNHLGKTVPESARAVCNAEQTPFFDTATEDFPVALLCGGKGLSLQGLAPSSENPFKPLNGRIDDPSLVFGRENEVTGALEFLRAGSSVVFLGEYGSGRSSLLTLLMDRVSRDLSWKTARLDLKMIEDEKSFYREFCEVLGVPEAKGYNLKRAFKGERFLLALEGVEKMTSMGFTRNLRDQLRGLAEGDSAPLKLAMTASTPLDRLFHDSSGNTSPLAGICQQIQIGPWDIETTRKFLHERLKTTPMTFSEAEVQHLFQSSSGMPKQVVNLAFDLYRRKSLQAAQALPGMRSLSNSVEMYGLSQALLLAQSVKDFHELVDLAEQKAFLQASTRPLLPEVLHPETWQALEHLRRCALEAHAAKESISKEVHSWALNLAIGEAIAARKVIAALPETERVMIEEIAINWQNLLVSNSYDAGGVPIQKPVKNPYMAGDPVVGAGFKGRSDILRSLKELWCGTTAPPSVVLCGHRRMGKTSILRNINLHLGSEVRLAYVNLLTLGEASGGLSDLFLAMADEIRAALPVLPEPETSEFDSHPYRAFEQYLGRAKDALGSLRLIIALDEFEQLEEWMRAGKIPTDLLNVLRGYMQKDEHIAFVFAGLHSLEEMTADYFNPLFASVRTILVSFLSRDATFQVLANPSIEDFPLDFSHEALERIWQLTGGQPYLVQLVGHYLVSRFNRLTFEQGKPMDPKFKLEDVEAVIEDPEFYNQGRYYFAGVWGQAGQGANGQQDILKLVALFPEGIPLEGATFHLTQDSDNLTAALAELQRHDILREKNGLWQFTVELTRRWITNYI